MAYVAPITWATGSDITAARLNQDLRDNVAFLATPPSCRVYNSATISHTTSGAVQYLTFNSERWDSQTMHSTASLQGRIVAPVAGKYMIGGNIEFAANATGARGIFVRLNGATTTAYNLQDNATAGAGNGLNITTLYTFAANDYVELGGYQSSGGALNMLASLNHSPEFWACWVSL